MAIDIIARGMIENSNGDVSQLSEKVNNHTGNSDIHVTTTDKDNWNGYANEIETNKTDISRLFDITKGGEIVSNESSYTINNAVDYPLMGLNLYGKSTQDGTPTPENPVDIVSVGDDGAVEITACGGNLFPWNDYTKAPINDWGLSTGCTYKVTSSEIQVEVAPNTASTGGGVFIWQGNYKDIISPYYGNTFTISYELRADSEITVRHGFEIEGINVDSVVGTEWKRFSCSTTIKNPCNICWKTINQPETILYIRKIQIEIGDTATDYEPYNGTTANITTALPLCGIPVDSGGNYTDSTGQQWVCDELVYNADGTGKIIKRTAKIDSYNGETVSGVYCSSTGGLDTGAAIIYQLDTPQESELTAAEMAALRQLQTFDGVTNISNDSGADMDVKVCTNKALSEFVYPITTGLQKQIDELKAAVISLGGNV